MAERSKTDVLTTAGGSRPVASAVPAEMDARRSSRLRVIATEEAFATAEYLDTFLKVASNSPHEGIRYAAMHMTRPDVQKPLTDIEARLADMDAHGVDMHLLSLTSPGVQVFDADLATELAARSNDELVAWIRKYSKRFCGLAAVAPQDPKRAAAEIERAIGHLGLNGVIINSHTNGEFLDDAKFFPIFEAAVKHRAPIYIHPTFPPPEMIKPFERYGMHGAIWGFAAECGLHAVRLVLGGVFDRFPDLQIVLGHMGEGLPYWLFRLDNMYAKTITHKNQPPGVVRLNRLPSEYIRSNFHLTTSGMFWNDVLEFAIKTMGIDRVIFAIDYPYETSKMATEFINNAPLSPADKALVLSRNAQKLFNIVDDSSCTTMAES
jgi:5-carboxyvanillate decarboxylase